VVAEIPREISCQVSDDLPYVLESSPAVLLCHGLDVYELPPPSRYHELTERNDTDILVDQEMMMPRATLLLLPHAAPVNTVPLQIVGYGLRSMHGLLFLNHVLMERHRHQPAVRQVDRQEPLQTDFCEELSLGPGRTHLTPSWPNEPRPEQPPADRR